MYYKEKWIDGRLFWKASPKGQWVEFTKEQYIQRVIELEQELELQRR